MNRAHLYYILPVVITCVMVSGLLNSQLIIVEGTSPGSVIIGRELLLYSWGALASTFPRFGRDFHHLSESRIGNLLSTFFLTDMIMFLWFPLWKRWQYNAVLQIALQCATPAGLILAFFTPSGSVFLLRIAFVLIGIGWSVSYFFSIYYSLSVPSNHARSGGLHEGFLSLGSLTGSLAAIGMMTLSARLNLLNTERLGAIALLIGVFGMILSLSLQTVLLKYRNKSLQDNCPKDKPPPDYFIQ